MAEVQDFQQRVLDEEKQLRDRIHALSRWIGSEKFATIDFEEQMLLREQLASMLSYQTILYRRIQKWDLTSELLK